MSQTNNTTTTPSRTRTIYATINRYRGRAPSISLKPVTFSLTDGTDIPPPVDTPPREATPPPPPLPAESARQERPKQESTDTSADKDSVSGPLSSHPVTPVETPPAAPPVNNTPFRIPRKSVPNGHSRQATNTSSIEQPQPSLQSDAPPQSQWNQEQTWLPRGYHQQRPSTAGPTASATAYVPNAEQTQHRPSFVQRFLRLRSLSSLRRTSQSSSRYGDSSMNLSRSQSQPLDYRMRGTKRPASPGSNAADSTSPDDRRDANGPTNFPRSVRKRSMELLSSSARRMSGMWSRQDVHSMMDLDRTDTTVSTKAARRQREREMELAREEQLRKEREAEIMAQPAPTITGWDRRLDGGRVGGDELFQNIGKS